jgi:hypothetical protein
MHVYLIKRAPKPDYHRAPFHPVILCTRKGVAKWEAGWTGDRAWVWEHGDGKTGCGGWLLCRWEGLDIDYGHVVRTCALPDGTHAAFFHQHRNLGYDRSQEPPKWLGYDPNLQEPWTLLSGAVWWSLTAMPEWLAEAGVVLPVDAFTQHRILDDYRYADMDERKWDKPFPDAPAWWPVPVQEDMAVTP